MPIRLLKGLSDIAADYDALVCDVWGVVHDGHHAHPAACDALRRFRERGPVVLLTNAPRVPEAVQDQFKGVGVPPDCYDVIVSSGGACRAELARRSARGTLPLYYIGSDRDLSIFQGLDIKLTGLDEAKVMLVTGLRDDDGETPADYGAELAAVAEKGLTMLCANPDLVVHRGKRLYWCAGALARDYAALGCYIIYYGKPHRPIYDVALAAVPDAKRPLAVGDGLFTDIMGANRAGLDVLFIADGVHGEETRPYTAEHLAHLFAGAGVTAMAACQTLRW